MTFYCGVMIKCELVEVLLDEWVDFAFALKLLLMSNGLCNDNEACFDIILGDVIGTFGISNWTWTFPGYGLMSILSLVTF